MGELRRMPPPLHDTTHRCSWRAMPRSCDLGNASWGASKTRVVSWSYCLIQFRGVSGLVVQIQITEMRPSLLREMPHASPGGGVPQKSTVVHEHRHFDAPGLVRGADPVFER